MNAFPGRNYKSYILSLFFFKRISDNYSRETDNKVSEHRAEWGSPPNERQLARITADAHDYKIPNGYFWNDVREASASDKNQKLQHLKKALKQNRLAGKKRLKAEYIQGFCHGKT